MTPFAEAYNLVIRHSRSFGTELLPLEEAVGLYLAEEIFADRDLPPFDRVTMDGIAIHSDALKMGLKRFKVSGIARAGEAVQNLPKTDQCFEVMTGAVLPNGADTVIRYEDISINGGIAALDKPVQAGKNIHGKGTDALKDSVLIPLNTQISPAEISILASVGKSKLLVHRRPKVILVSTGDELVEPEQVPEPHQIRKSNIYALSAALDKEGIVAEKIHLPDHPETIEKQLRSALERADVLMLSGGVSMGKFDYLPEVLGNLGVEKAFHKVAQRPGKPFWFGIHPEWKTTVFSFPGNPVSTFLNYHLYFRNWLRAGMGIQTKKTMVEMGQETVNSSDLTHFKLLRIEPEQGMLKGYPVPMNGSGDFLSLSRAHGFVQLEPSDKEYPPGCKLPFIPFKTNFL
ncbi:molybdopterin molybdotransferase MoeA [Robiginitalea sp. IMCC44478]|uniref:molybdopterin molybdotransferase MoeA n=1 Tax=Robiginitalea sp. IMCC44478 TaxID=3459122 RepID=UPI0040434423